MGFLFHPSCEQIVFTMINSGDLIMLVVEWLEDVGCGCEETLPYVACSTRSHEADNRSCERLQKWK
jgi:phosphopantetheinyl transferase